MRFSCSLIDDILYFIIGLFEAVSTTTVERLFSDGGHSLMAAITVSGGGAVWWTLTRWRQVWCVCCVKTVWSYMSASEVSFSQWGAKQIYYIYLFTLKPGFHYPSWRHEVTAGVDGWPVSTTRQHGPSTRLVETGHPSTRPVNSGRQLG